MIKSWFLYNELKGVILVNYYKDGEIESFSLEEKNEISIGNNIVIPVYEFESERRKYVPSIKFYEGGDIKTICLQKSKEISCSIGCFEVEKITFYREGKIQRLFLLDGRISGYWTEEDEYNLAKIYKIHLGFTKIDNKIISLCFYENGNLKAMTLWPKETIVIALDVNKLIKGRIGISLYEDGALKSCEPSKPEKINTPIGEIEAYNENALGIHGENNSLKFYKDGKIQSLITSTSVIKVCNKCGDIVAIYASKVKSHHLVLGWTEKETIKVEFEKDYIIINSSYKYNYLQYNISVVNPLSFKNIKSDNINLSIS